MNSSEILGTVLLVIGAIIAVSEMHTLTIYLIALAVACFAGAAAAFAGASLPLSLSVLGAVALLGLPVAHWVRKRMKNHASDQVTQDDVGRTVNVVEVGAERLRVSYRGSTWNAHMHESHALEPQVGQTLRIVAREGNTLLLGPQEAA
jgi:membrane protein implicated in regulation of membrane protease activity